MRDVFHLKRKEGAAAGGFRKLFQILVSAQDQTAVIGRDSVDDHFGSLRHLDRLRLRVFALVVVPIAENDQCPADRPIRLLLEELVLASMINRIVERRAAAVVEGSDAPRKALNIVGEILRKLLMNVETHHKSGVEARPDGVLQKAGSSVLFEVESCPD